MQPEWHQKIAGRVLYVWPLKAVGTSAFMLAFFWAYFSILNQPNVTPTVIPAIWLDYWIAFTPWSLPVYASLWVYVSLPAALTDNLRTLLLITGWTALLCIACLLFFWVFPTQTPDFGIDWKTHPSLALIKNVDMTGNAFPSLHVASAVFSAFWLDRIWKQLNAPYTVRWISVAHCLAIVWSTLALRQHVALDALSGALVGTLFAVASLRHAGSAVQSEPYRAITR